MNKTISKKAMLPALLATIGLTACGGGSGGSGNSTESLQGSVSKGLVVGGQVDILTSANGELLAQATTNSNGVFTVELDTMPDVIFVRVTAASDGSTMMQCDWSECGAANSQDEDSNNNGVIDFGEWQQVDESFELTGWITAEQARQQSFSINPFTHAAAQQFSSAPSGSALDDAYADIQSTFSLYSRPDQIQVQDVTDSSLDTAQLQDQLMAASVLRLYAPQSSSVEEALQAVTESNQAVTDISMTDVTNIVLQAVMTQASNDDYADMTASLTEANNEASEQENRLSNSDLPMLPPLQ